MLTKTDHLMKTQIVLISYHNEVLTIELVGDLVVLPELFVGLGWVGLDRIVGFAICWNWFGLVFPLFSRVCWNWFGGLVWFSHFSWFCWNWFGLVFQLFSRVPAAARD